MTSAVPERIDELLASRHAKDVWVPECKMGSSWAGCRVLDGWALLKTWSPWTTIGYEIKRSRSDFLQDRKWQEYLPVCHEFYFVSPAKLIAPEELPAEVGLLWAGARLVCKRKAVHRQADPEKLLRLVTYVLMSRVRVVADMDQAVNRESRQEFWRRWLTEGGETNKLGHDVSRRIRTRLAEAEAARRQAQYERDRLEGVRETLRRLGIPEGSASHEVERQITRPNGEQLRLVAELARQIVRAAQA